MRFRWANSLVSCRWKVDPCKKNVRFQNIRIRVDVAAEFGTAVARRLQQVLVPEILRISQMSQFMFENAYKHMSYT